MHRNKNFPAHRRTGGLLGRKPTILVDRSINVRLVGKAEDFVRVTTLGILLSPPMELLTEATEGAFERVERTDWTEGVD